MALQIVNQVFSFGDESVNSYGFRLLNKGAEVKQFLKNPIMLWMHNRAGNKKDDVLPLGKWEGLKFETNQWMAKPSFDDNDAFAMMIKEKVETGIIKMCSMGIVPLETSNKSTLKIAGQTLPTITKWLLRECSLVDIGSNAGAVALAEKDNDNVDDVGRYLHLFLDNKKTFFYNLKPINMDTNIPYLNRMLNLADSNTDMGVIQQAVSHLIQAKNQAEKKLQEVQDTLHLMTQNKINALLDKAIQEAKISVETSIALKKLFDDDVAGLEKLLSTFGVQQNLVSQLKEKRTEGRVEQLVSKGMAALLASGEAEMLKTLDVVSFNKLYREYFGKNYVAD